MVRWAVLLLLVVVASTGGLTLAPAVGARPPSQAAVAARLAKAVTGARTPAARYRALLAVMRAMHIGVYRGNGRAIAHGAERSARDLYVYDFTLRLLGDALATRTTIAAADLAHRLAVEIAALRRPAPSAATLRSRLRTAVLWAGRHPRSRDALVPLLLRELGRRTHRQDLRAPPAPDKLSFDPVQAFLVQASVAGAVLDWSRGAPAHRTGASAARNACQDFKPLYEAYEHTKFVLTLLGGAGAAAHAVAEKVVEVVTKGGLNYALIDNLIAVTGSPADRAYTHYGPRPHRGAAGLEADVGGRPLSFDVHVQTTRDYANLAADCGYLAGINMPRAGDVSGAPVTWQDDGGAKDLAGHGTLVRQDAATDDAGDAVAEFRPADERMPGIGKEDYVAYGTLRARVNLAEWLGGPALSLDANFWATLPPKLVLFPYGVAAHRPAGLRFRADVPVDWVRVNHGIEDDAWVENRGNYVERWSGYICGSDPEGLWTITGDMAWMMTPWNPEVAGGPAIFDGAVLLKPGQLVTVIDDLSVGPSLSVRLGDAEPPTSTVMRGATPTRANALIPYITYSDEPVGSDTWTVPITEDTAHCIAP